MVAEQNMTQAIRQAATEVSRAAIMLEMHTTWSTVLDLYAQCLDQVAQY